MGKNCSARHYTDNYYQAVAKRSHVVASPLLLSLHRLHPSPIAPFARVVTGDTTSRVTNGAAGAGLQRAHLVHHVHRYTTCTTWSEADA